MKGFILFLLLFPVLGISQTHDIPKLKTAKYAGVYTYGDTTEYGAGSIIIYPESDTTVLFYFETNRGAPSYH